MPLLSIIIPCYNSSAYIEKGLNSLRKQNFKDYEVIAVDDMSTDNTVSVLQKYKENTDIDLSILVNKENLGPAGSRNRALKVAKGKYVAFMDSDDFVEPSYFNDILSEIYKGADLINIGSNLVVGESKIFSSQAALKTKEEWIALTTGALWKLITRSDLWKDIALPNISNAEDIAVIPILFYRAQQIANIDKPLYNYIYSVNSISSKRDKKIVKNFCTSFKYTMEHFPKDEYHDGLEFHGIKTILYGATLNAVKAGFTNTQIKTIIVDFEKDWPNWHQNKYINKYKGRKQFYLKLVKSHDIWAVRLFVNLQELYLRLRG